VVFRPRDLASRMAGRRKPDDGYLRETFTLPRDKARARAGQDFGAGGECTGGALRTRGGRVSLPGPGGAGAGPTSCGGLDSKG